MGKGKNKCMRMAVISMSILSITVYSARVCGIHTIHSMAVEIDDGKEETIEKNRTIKKTTGKENYLVLTKNGKIVKKIQEKYAKTDTISDNSEGLMEEECVVPCELTGLQAFELQQQENVLRVEKDCIVKANASPIKNRKVKRNKQSKMKKEWNMAMVKAPLQKKENTDKVKVAVIDSGVDFGNDVELQDYIDLVPGYEECLPYYTDITGHGSSVAGIIAAQDNKVGITGINPNVQLYSARVLDEKNKAPVSRVVEAIYWAIDHDVNIINMSFGLNQDSEILHRAIQDAYNAGILLVAAAGNNGKVEYPAAYEEVIAVGAVDSEGIVCENSAKGSEIELVAPGEKIASTGAFQGTLVCSGTSLAAPHVTGIASMLWERDRSVSADFIRALLQESANGYGNSDAYGNGLVDYKYAEEIYESFKEDYQKNNRETENYNNETAIQTISENKYVEGRWDSTYHQKLVTNTGTLSVADVATIKKGIVYPDLVNSGIRGLGDNPGFHGGGNYVLNAIYLSYLARDGEIKEASNYFSQSILNTYKSSLDIMYNKLVSCQNKGDITNKFFLWGIALHSLSDSFSHNSIIKNPTTGKWFILVHENSPNKGKDGYLTEADNPYVSRARFDSAQISVDMALYELRNGREWTFRVYQHETYFNSYNDYSWEGYPYYNWPFKMLNLFQFAKQIDYGANYAYILKQATYGSVK